jgi:hypothetical protein
MKHGAAPQMPTSKQRITINLSDAEYAELAALAERHNLSMAWIGHKALTNFLEQHRETVQLALSFRRPPEPATATERNPKEQMNWP